MPRELISEASPLPPQPLSSSDFAALLRAFSLPQAAPLALAVSGGPDSMALAYCAKRWIDETGQGRSVIAFLVDHALRPESGGEAIETQRRLQALGIHADILLWDHAPLVTRLHASARKARYGLLLDACRRHGIAHLLLAHQREDQGETILMRLAKGSGIDGLAGMKAETTKDNIHLLRPFLSVPKECLIATCDEAGVPYLNDPSNASTKFARGRLRRVMHLLDEEGLTIERLVGLGERAGDVRDALDHYTLAFLRVAVTRDDAGCLRLDLEHLRAAPHAVALRALSVALRSIHQGEYAPEYLSLTRLLAMLRSEVEMPPRTLHGCLVSKGNGEALIMREYAAITDMPTLLPGESVAWDQRWRVGIDPSLKGGPYTVRPLGNPSHEMLDKMAPGLRHHVPQGRARASLPSLWEGEVLTYVGAPLAKTPIYTQLLVVWPPQAV